MIPFCSMQQLWQCEINAILPLQSHLTLGCLDPCLKNREENFLGFQELNHDWIILISLKWQIMWASSSCDYVAWHPTAFGKGNTGAARSHEIFFLTTQSKMEIMFMMPKPSRKAHWGCVLEMKGSPHPCLHPGQPAPISAGAAVLIWCPLLISASAHQEPQLGPRPGLSSPLRAQGMNWALLKPSLQGRSGCAQGAGCTVLLPRWHHGDSASAATTAPHLQMLLSTSRLKQFHSWACCSCFEEEQPWDSLARPLFAASQMLGLLSRAALEGNSNIKAQLCRLLSTGLKSSSQLCGLNSGLVTHSHRWHPGCGLNTT